MTFGENLRKWRSIRGYTRREMGEKLGISEAAFGLYETDRTKPDTTKLLMIAEILQVSTDELLEFRLNEFARCKNFWEECGYTIDETTSGMVCIIFNGRAKQITVEGGKAAVREYDLLTLNNRQEFIELTKSVNVKIKEQMKEARAALFDVIITSTWKDWDIVTEDEKGQRTYHIRPNHLVFNGRIKVSHQDFQSRRA